ncbi:hypothetical protein [Lysinibacillus sp. Bpr_S20]|uniref:hypothetical protein n=1 Tax=Lysinibacillus sp. Bpr_S20 TaxID=2933964 RepID=UPI00201399A9|nr:hypothetical protein [Lysinibacillus sp. Bpr_S20]MCL1702652.1 hypothetical protein [Lysinibacillus sp. Bpr_S20]
MAHAVAAIYLIVIILGLTLHYIYNSKKIRLFFLLLISAIAVFLLIVTAIDLLKGGNFTMAHSVAAILLGVPIVSGMSIIPGADDMFLYYIKKEGTKSEKKTGFALARHSLKESFQHLFVYIIGAGFLFIVLYLVNVADHIFNLFETLKVWSLVLGIDFIISISYFIWPRGK